ncbi:MAG TPA: HEWD family protein [Halococcus sp.]|nr:HEWD family protein [Halococcus sp.]
MSESLVPPTERECERCGRRDVWDTAAENWTIEDTGLIHCVHEWDISGSYNPFHR